MTHSNYRLLTIVGARPQFVKAAAVSRAIARFNAGGPDRQIEESIVHTGQHYDQNMSQVFFDELNIPRPDHHLEIGSGSHGAQTGRMLERIEQVMLDTKPDGVLVYGDTNSTLAGALAAAKLHIPIGHVEAGLRSFNRRMPEEINRVTTDHISSLLFCPTDVAVRHLAAEGVTQGVHQVGDVMYDCVLFYAEKAEPLTPALFQKLGIEAGCFKLATVHRAENTDDPEKLRSIFDSLAALSSDADPVVLCLHPRTKSRLEAFQIEPSPKLRIVPPVSYLEMIALEKHANLILTDSGGVQKEAYWFQTPCVTLREETEWIETVETGWNKLAGAHGRRILYAAKQFSRTPDTWSAALYGDGSAADTICGLLMSLQTQD